MSAETDDKQPTLLTDSPNTRSQFFELYSKEAKEYDEDFVQKYGDDLGSTLIFAGLLAGVSSAFILNVQTNLQPDNTATTVALMKILIHAIDNSTFAGTDLTLPVWTGPDATFIAIQTLLYLSLAVTLFAAFISMLGKQWINRYARRKRGTLAERVRDRQQKLDGIENWGFRLIMESLPLMLQSSLFLLAVALSQYMWGIDTTVAAVIIGVTAFGALFYISIVISAAIFYYCPFQTPFSSVIHHLYDNAPSWLKARGRLYIRSTLESVYASTVTMKRWMVEPFAHRSIATDAPVAPLFDDQEDEFPNSRLDVRCAMWMCDTSTDSDVAVTAIQLISDVAWDANVNVTHSLHQVLSRVHKYCDLMSSYPSTIRNRGDKAYAAAKAFLHLYVQRRCVSDEEVTPITSKGLGYLGLHAGVWNNDLESTLWMIDHIVEEREVLVWPGFNKDVEVSIPHISWFCRILLYHVWASKQGQIADIKGVDTLLELALSRSTSLSLSNIADCLLVCALTLGLRMHVQDLSVTNKGRIISSVVDKLYVRLEDAFQPSVPRESVERAVKVLRMLTLWQGQERTKHIKANTSLKLCKTILDSRLKGEIKWEAARLSMQIGFRDRSSDIFSHSAKGCITFLEHHLTHERYYYDSLADAFHALNSLSPIPNVYSEGKVVRVICWALRNRKSKGLTEMALQLVHRIRRALSQSVIRGIFIEHDFSAALEDAWNYLALADTDDTVHRRRYFDILAVMSDSSIWHPYILSHHQDNLEYAASYDQDWLFSLLKSNYARDALGSKAAAAHIRIGWKTGSYLVDRDNLSSLVYSTINLLIMRGRRAISEVSGEINEAFLSVTTTGEKATDIYPVDVHLRLAVLKEVVRFIQGIELHAPDGWELVVVEKAKGRRRKAVDRFRRRREK